ncbi:MAG TPA: lipid-A-disaccharide synthase, partial [Thermoanaerobaculia bacterium]|nr:lipid-A-disaccharide synthase [Thermoanaerobaculia bacterium]
LPGSRRSEIAALFPIMLQAARELSGRVPLRIRVIQAPTIRRELLVENIAAAGFEEGTPELEIVADDRFAAIADSHLALCASGTATLEVGLLGTPMIVVYRLATWTYLLARMLVRLPNISLVNLVLERRVVPELIQDDANPQRIAGEAEKLLRDSMAREAARAGLAELRGRLGEGGASRRAAQEVVAALGLNEPRMEPQEATA